MNNNTLHNIDNVFNKKNFKELSSLPGFNFSNYSDTIKANIQLNLNNNIIDDIFFTKLLYNKTKKNKSKNTKTKKK